MHINELIAQEFCLQPDIIYLNHAAVAPWPQRTKRTVQQFAEENATLGSKNYLQWVEHEFELRAMLEVHIEQGGVLESKGHKIGLVEAIAGIQHLAITVTGTANHAGTTPMNDRSDALQAAARIIIAVEKIAQKIGSNTVATVGRIRCEPGQVNVIPGAATFSLDIRNADKTILDSAVTTICRAVKDICTKRGLEFEITPLSSALPVSLSAEIVDLMEKMAREKNIEPFRMVSGAGHDTAILADLTAAGMIFVPSKKGRSHCPEEFTLLEDIALGCEVLLSTVVALAE